MNAITVIILTKNEETNIEKCIQSARRIANRIIVVDSGSIDKTVEIAQKIGADVYFHEWLGHAKQFNWALDHCEINTKWVFRLDADEQISDELAEEIKATLNSPESDHVNGYAMRWYVYFMNRQLRYGGTHKPYFLRLFRYGTGRVEDKMMDERIIVNGVVKQLNGSLIHYDYKGLDAWLTKHIWYSQLELSTYVEDNRHLDESQQLKKRGFYYRLPIFFRARLYYWYRYYVQLGFLDGKEGKVFCFLQAYWYRFLIDAKIFEREKK